MTVYDDIHGMLPHLPERFGNVGGQRMIFMQIVSPRSRHHIRSGFMDPSPLAFRKRTDNFIHNGQNFRFIVFVIGHDRHYMTNGDCGTCLWKDTPLLVGLDVDVRAEADGRNDHDEDDPPEIETASADGGKLL